MFGDEEGFGANLAGHGLTSSIGPNDIGPPNPTFSISPAPPGLTPFSNYAAPLSEKGFPMSKEQAYYDKPMTVIAPPFNIDPQMNVDKAHPNFAPVQQFSNIQNQAIPQLALQSAIKGYVEDTQAVQQAMATFAPMSFSQALQSTLADMNPAMAAPENTAPPGLTGMTVGTPQVSAVPGTVSGPVGMTGPAPGWGGLNEAGVPGWGGLASGQSMSQAGYAPAFGYSATVGTPQVGAIAGVDSGPFGGPSVSVAPGWGGFSDSPSTTSPSDSTNAGPDSGTASGNVGGMATGGGPASTGENAGTTGPGSDGSPGPGSDD